MKLKHLQALKSKHENYMRYNAAPQPKIGKHAITALMTGDKLVLRPLSDIVKRARTRLVEDRYNGENISMEDVFSSCNGYAQEFKEWNHKEGERQKRIKAYLKVAEPLMRTAEFNEESDPEEIASKLAEAAYESGLTV